ncbi:MAG: 50S ribosomal protein L17 [Ureaplasma sp.]|nr:50S ribosomal protein L17 [Ureaplasma sp.]MDE7222123.1 50S ribosomal protein L17 [Ureaplasma sp.]
MSFINKKGKTRAWRKMVTRQQVTDVIAYNELITTKTKAKETQRHVDRIITLAKKNTLASRRQAASILLDNKKFSKDELLKKLFNDLGKKYSNRNGGYTRVLKLGARQGDNTELAIIQLV